MRVPESFTRQLAGAFQPMFKEVCSVVVWSSLVAFLLLPLSSTPLRAEESPVRGDLPPVGNGILQEELDGLTTKQAKALFEQIHELLSNRLTSDVSGARALYLGAIQGMLDQVNAEQDQRTGALPPPGMLLSSTQAQRIRDALNGQVTGIGIEFQLQSQHGVLVVSRVIPGSPAETAGMLAGDHILAIDGQRFAGASLAEVLLLLQGTEGTDIAFEFARNSPVGPARYVMQLDRGTFRVESSEAHLETNRVGYLKLHQFHIQTSNEATEHLRELTEQGARHFVIDLRGCVGGNLEAARALADLFLPQGTVVAHVDEPGVGSEDLLASSPLHFEQELVILIDRWTRGAAELLAASLQEHDRAFLIGEPTMGRAQGETLIALGNDLFLRIESVQLGGPMGTSWAESGVQPDQPIWISSQGIRPSPRSTGDLQFQTALHYLAHELMNKTP
jgi:carboxyl-terminal processing protease